MRQAACGLKIGNELTVSDEARELAEKARAVRLVLIRANSSETCGREKLLEKEAACCNLATD